jgi:hypothetical protein
VIAALFAATLGAQLVAGQMAGPLARIGDGGLSSAAAVFIAGSAVLCRSGLDRQRGACQPSPRDLRP